MFGRRGSSHCWVHYSRTTKGRRALGGHELRGRVAKGLASMLWDTCKTVVCLFWLSPLGFIFKFPINGILFSWSRSTFPSLSSFTAGHPYSLTDTDKHPASCRLSASVVALYWIVACTTCIMFYATLCVSCSLWGVLVLVKEIYTALGMLRLMVGLLFSDILLQRLCCGMVLPFNLMNSDLYASIGPFLMWVSICKV